MVTRCVVFNDSQTQRTPLSVARSLDEGRTWETPLHLESNPGEYSYPCVIQTGDGKIHVTLHLPPLRHQACGVQRKLAGAHRTAKLSHADQAEHLRP